MIADQNFYDTYFTIFYPTASATAYGQRPKFVMAEHSATAEGENCAYGPTLPKLLNVLLPFFKLGSQLLLAIWDFKVYHIEFEHPVRYNYLCAKLLP